MGFLSAEQLLLDEAQGVTTAMIVECIGRRGWHLTANGFQWQTLDKSTSRVRIISALHGGILAIIATHEEMTLQQLLREINPRMRPWPSIEARRAHSGPWLALYVESEAIINGSFRPDIEVFASFSIHADILFESDDFARFWPCDAHGNKVRWPTDDNGNML